MLTGGIASRRCAGLVLPIPEPRLGIGRAHLFHWWALSLDSFPLGQSLGAPSDANACSSPAISTPRMRILAIRGRSSRSKVFTAFAARPWKSSS